MGNSMGMTALRHHLRLHRLREVRLQEGIMR
jgi:hypothetical protein